MRKKKFHLKMMWWLISYVQYQHVYWLHLVSLFFFFSLAVTSFGKRLFDLLLIRCGLVVHFRSLRLRLPLFDSAVVVFAVGEGVGEGVSSVALELSSSSSVFIFCDDEEDEEEEDEHDPRCFLVTIVWWYEHNMHHGKDNVHNTHTIPIKQKKNQVQRPRNDRKTNKHNKQPSCPNTNKNIQKNT